MRFTSSLFICRLVYIVIFLSIWDMVTQTWVRPAGTFTAYVGVCPSKMSASQRRFEEPYLGSYHSS